MKKVISLMLAVLMVLSVSVLFVSAAESAEVYVTISDEAGKLAVAAEKVTVTDIDGDGALTVNDALYAAHEQFYEGGAAAGYATDTTQWGLSLMKLWGTANGGSYGYMINNASAWSMTDPVTDGDYVAAYVFTEPERLLDKYAYFDKLFEDVTAGEVTLTLKKNDFDEQWNPVTLPVVGATITVDGNAIEAVTDENGQVTFTLETNGKHLVSATASDQVITPPVYFATVSGGTDPVPATTPESETIAPTEAATQTSTTAATPDSKNTNNNKNTTSTGSNTNAVKTGSTVVYVMLAFIVMAMAVVLVAKKKHEN